MPAPSDSPSPTPRTPRPEVRRRLLDAAVRVFAEHGYAEARLDDIAHAAGFSKGAVYSNFGSKQELFGAVLSQGADSELDTVLTQIREAEDAGAAARRAAGVVARRVVDDPVRGRLGLEFAARAVRDDKTRQTLAPLRRAQRDAVAGLVAEVAERGGVTRDVDPKVLALILHCLTNGLSMEHLADPDTVTTEMVEQAISTVLDAFGAAADQSA